MKKDTKFLLGLVAFGFVMHRFVIPRLPTPPGIPDRIPGSTTAGNKTIMPIREQKIAGQTQIAQR